ncbi:unnamed protein product [Schistosoma mattheei]|uniref:Uncharacterized protein n=1 Tax=Schistosoma mattheei TaxID=31246 RepID=A0A183NIQ6_9TREM|nr:unnamed protein product [Schistosoma mattheei]
MGREDEEFGLVVIGAGLGRTGTNSLKIALELLYKKPCYHLKEIYLHQHSHITKWMELDRKLSDSPDKKLDKALCHKIFKGYTAAIDHPSCAYYKELLELYPNAKWLWHHSLSKSHPKILNSSPTSKLSSSSFLASGLFIRSVSVLSPSLRYLAAWFDFVYRRLAR